jgi:carboxyl-terminal processing protease
MGSLEEILGEFFPKRVDIGTFVERGGRKETDHSVRRWTSAGYSGPVVVLVSRESASCAEIFAEVLRYYHRAAVIGSRTGGNVLGSDIEPLPGGGELQYSVLDYLAPDGHRLEGKGVAPDIEVQPTLGDLRLGVDRAIETGLKKLGGPSASQAVSSH